MPFFKLEAGTKKGAIFPIRSDRFTIGRSPQNDIRIKDDTVSSRHALITRVNDAYFIEDLESANGTYVNGIKIERRRLRDNDEIVLGKTRLRYVDAPIPEEGEEKKVPTKRRDSKEIIGSFRPDTPSPKSIEELRQAHENLKRVYEISGLISSIFDTQELFKKILDIIFPIFDADRGYIMLLDTSGELQLAAAKKREGESAEDSSDVAFSRTIATRVLEQEESIITSDAPADRRFSGKASILHGHIKSAMCVPIRGRKETLGIIYIDHRGAKGHFTDEHLQLLTMVASSTGVALDNIRLYEENLQMRILEAVNEEMRETNRKLMELEALKEDLINMVVHDMKNPVTNTMMALDMLLMTARDTPADQQSDYLQLAKRNQFKLSEMITNLLEISRLESGAIQIEKKWLDPSGLVQRTVNRYAAIIERDAKTVSISADSAIREIFCDESLLERILANILSNAIKHSLAEGKILVSIAPAREENCVLFSIKDFGEGIPREYHEKIFEKFFQAGLRELGHQTDTGLGLAFCKMAVEALGGSIWLESEPGKGSAFTFSLPGALRP